MKVEAVTPTGKRVPLLAGKTAPAITPVKPTKERTGVAKRRAQGDQEAPQTDTSGTRSG